MGWSNLVEPEEDSHYTIAQRLIQRLELDDNSAITKYLKYMT